MSGAPRRGLGKGLGALLPQNETPRSGLTEVPIDQIFANPHQPRHHIEDTALQELADSIRTHGVIQPLVVTRAGDKYQLIAGERRWRAARLAGLSHLPVVIKDASPQEMLELALIENLQRADLNPLEEAHAFQQLVQEFGLTHEQIAARVGKSRVAITNAMRLLRLPEAARDALMAGAISEGHARALLGLEAEEDMLVTLEVIQKRGLSVRQTEEWVRRLAAVTEMADEEEARPARKTSPETDALENRLRERLGTKVNLYRGRRGGRMIIHFYSEEELQAIYDILLND
ncbi:MAG: ParB/RepB/Spo0J family partition protein [Chloroflexi bacterium]|nr:ParB/RepB/Spo0J family partition protein [Chloroflexota bacterium]